MRRSIALLTVAAALVVGCGGDDPAEPERPRSAGPSPESVVRGWADDLRRGDVDAATDRFAVPAIVANGTPEVRLESRAEIRVFNETLPCGGRITETTRHQGLVIATFELTKRPGARCDGAGNTARAAFEVREGRIVRWLRVPAQGERDGPPPGGPVV